MTVKETYCSVRNLVPNTQYEFWVTAQNRAGVSPASERVAYMTGKAATCPQQGLPARAPGVMALFVGQGSGFRFNGQR